MTNKEEFKIVREFKASKELVFNAFSNAEALAQWWGPKEMPIKVIKLDFRPKGIFHYKMEGNGNVMWGLFVYGKINKPDLIEFVNSFSNEKGEICKAPFDMAWPLEVFNRLTLAENNGLTTLTLAGHPINATEEEEKTYYAFTASMQQGFGSTFDQLDEYLRRQN